MVRVNDQIFAVSRSKSREHIGILCQRKIRAQRKPHVMSEQKNNKGIRPTLALIFALPRSSYLHAGIRNSPGFPPLLVNHLCGATLILLCGFLARISAPLGPAVVIHNADVLVSLTAPLRWWANFFTRCQVENC
jgi:hypothetical protein